MRLWHRGVALLTLLSMIWLQAGSAVGAATDAGQKAERLTAFGIIKPNETLDEAAVTRAQMAAWVCRAAGMDFDDAAGSGTIFADVQAEHAYSGAVEMAFVQGVVSRDATAMFYPDRQVSLLEAVAMAVNAMGYSEIAAAYGGYPNGYWTVASQQSLTKGVTAQELEKEDAVRLISNMLDADSVRIKFVNGNPAFDINPDFTFLEDKFDVTKYKVQIDEIDTSRKTILATVLSGDKKGQQIKYRYTDAVAVEKAGGEATAYIDNSEPDLMVYLETKQASAVIYDFIDQVNKRDAHTNVTLGEWRHVYFTNQDRQYTLSDDVQVTYNDELVEYEAYDYIGCFAKAVIQDNTVTRMDIYPLEEGGLIYRADADELRYTRGTDYENYWTGFSRAPDLQIIIDGRAGCKMQDLRTDMVFDYWFGGGDKFIIVASSRVAKGVISGYTGDEIIVKNEKYMLSEKFGWYVYSAKDNSYNPGQYADIAGESVSAFIDDNQRVRYVRPDVSKSEKRTFCAFVMRAYEDEGTDERYVKLFRADGNNETVTYKLRDKLKAGSYGFSYLQSVEKNMDALGFLQFTVDAKDEVTKVEPVENFGYVASHSGDFDYAYFQIAKQYAGEAKIFALMEIDGQFTVKPVNYESELPWTKPTNSLTVISDFDVEKNPVPNYIVMGKGSETIRETGSTFEILESIEWKEDDMFVITFLNGESYTVSEKFIQDNKLTECSMVRYHRKSLGKDPIVILDVTDLSAYPEDWKTDAYSAGAGTGFYRADDIVIRNDNVIQFKIGGKKTDVYMFYDDINGGGGQMKVYEFVKKGKLRQAPTTEAITSQAAPYIRPVQKYPVMNIQKGDNVWFHLRQGDDGMREIDYMIYESKASFFD